MKKICIKILACLFISLSAISLISMYMPVDASGIEPYSYYTERFSFKGTCGISRDCSGMFMSVKVKATASNNNNETITLKVQVQNTGKVHTYTFLSDGQYHEYKNMFDAYAELQREVFELMFRKGWYVLEQAESDKISKKYMELKNGVNEM